VLRIFLYPNDQLIGRLRRYFATAKGSCHTFSYCPFWDLYIYQTLFINKELIIFPTSLCTVPLHCSTHRTMFSIHAHMDHGAHVLEKNDLEFAIHSTIWSVRARTTRRFSPVCMMMFCKNTPARAYRRGLRRLARRRGRPVLPGAIDDRSSVVRPRLSRATAHWIPRGVRSRQIHLGRAGTEKEACCAGAGGDWLRPAAARDREGESSAAGRIASASGEPTTALSRAWPRWGGGVRHGPSCACGELARPLLNSEEQLFLQCRREEKQLELPARFVGVGVVGRWRERFEGDASSSPKLFTVRTSEKGTSGGEDEVPCLLDR
jgi:hypothetical protein